MGKFYDRLVCGGETLAEHCFAVTNSRGTKGATFFDLFNAQLYTAAPLLPPPKDGEVLPNISIAMAEALLLQYPANHYIVYVPAVAIQSGSTTGFEPIVISSTASDGSCSHQCVHIVSMTNSHPAWGPNFGGCAVCDPDGQPWKFRGADLEISGHVSASLCDLIDAQSDRFRGRVDIFTMLPSTRFRDPRLESLWTET